MATIAVFAATPGVGKTALAFHLLAALARRGQRPLGIDLDSGGGLSRLFGAVPASAAETTLGCIAGNAELADVARITASGIGLCPAHPGLANVERASARAPAALERIARGLASPVLAGCPAVIDCGAKFGVPTLNALAASDVLVVPVSPAAGALDAARRVAAALPSLERVLGRPLACRYLASRVGDDLEGEALWRELVACFGAGAVAASRVIEAVEVREALAGGIDVFRGAADSAAARAYEAVLCELIGAPASPAAARERTPDP